MSILSTRKKLAIISSCVPTTLVDWLCDDRRNYPTTTTLTDDGCLVVEWEFDWGPLRPGWAFHFQLVWNMDRDATRYQLFKVSGSSVAQSIFDSRSFWSTLQSTIRDSQYRLVEDDSEEYGAIVEEKLRYLLEVLVPSVSKKPTPRKSLDTWV